LIAGFVEPSAGEIPGRRPVSCPRRHGRCRRSGAKHVHDLPELCSVAAHDGRGGTSPNGLKLRKVDRATMERKLAAILDTTHLRPARRPGIRASSRADQQAARSARAPPPHRRGPRRLLLDRAACPISMPICAKRCASRCAACTTSIGTPRFYVTHDPVGGDDDRRT